MSSRYYPVFLDIEGRLAMVVGGGAVAEGKVTGLLAARARVMLVSPEATPALEGIARDGLITWAKRRYKHGDLSGAWMVVVATNDTDMNYAIAAEATAAGVLVNVVDSPAQCSFIAPAVVRRDDLTIAISTGGKSPAIARRVREEMERLFPPEYGALLEIAARVREALQREGLRASPDLWQRALSPEVIDLVRQGRSDEATALLTESLRPGLIQR